MIQTDKPNKTHQKSILKVFVVFTIVSFISFFTITSLALKQSLSKTLSDIENHTRESELNSISKNAEQYVESRIQVLKDIGSNPAIIRTILDSNQDRSSIKSFLDSVLILGEKSPVILFDKSGTEIYSSTGGYGKSLSEEYCNKILKQERRYIVDLIQNGDKTLMLIMVPVFHNFAIKGIL
jgi:hypothetical protein